ncbi:MAG TPA: hypothetical protein ENJ28_11290 [Gammaproteobacteria bacterium]|nr:hypothetical protein [Gammaproteobacteria bacterium]
MSDMHSAVTKWLATAPILGASLLLVITGLFVSNGHLTEISRNYAPPGQTLYLLSKITAIFVYTLMWWQIMAGIITKVKKQLHTLLGMGVFTLIIIHVILFISAVSIRQDELSLGMLLPNFSSDYYKTGMSFGVMALFFIFIATLTGIFRKRLKNHWKLGHSFVYVTFALATVHGLMIGSDINSDGLSYFIYGAVISLILAFVYKKGKHLLRNRCFQ